MFDYLYGTRLDKFDYENSGIADRWCIRGTIQILICFEMELKNYFNLKSAKTIYEKLWNKYRMFIFAAIRANKFPYNHGLPNNHDEGEGSFEVNSANYKRSDFLTYLSNNNEVKVDLDKFYRVLAGEEVPGLVIATEQPSNTWHVITAEDLRRINASIVDYEEPQFNWPEINEPTSEPVVVNASIDNQYRFEKSDKGWNLQFNDVTLQGVKDWAGMSYIKILLQNPDQKISVIKLQELAGTGDPRLDDNEELEDCTDPDVVMDRQEYDTVPDKKAPKGRIILWESSDLRAIQEYKEQIVLIEDKLKEARSCKVLNMSKIERLEKDKDAYESQLNEASYKGKDPDVDKARKSVRKAIVDTIKNIGKLEVLSNYNDKPISSHLGRYIIKGASCSYVTSGENPPSWQF